MKKLWQWLSGQPDDDEWTTLKGRRVDDHRDVAIDDDWEEIAVDTEDIGSEFYIKYRHTYLNRQTGDVMTTETIDWI